jgi:hypothetical protein
MSETFISNDRLATHAQQRPAGYLDEIAACVVRRGEGGVYINEQSDEWRALLAKYAPARDAEDRAERFAGAQRIPDDFDPEVERDAARQGGCCGAPSI